MSWRRLSVLLLFPFLLGSDRDARAWADFLEQWLYGTTMVTSETPALARIDELQDRIFQAENAAGRSTVWFASGSDVLDEGARGTLHEFAEVATALPGVRFHLAGHADAIPGRSRSNQALSLARAERARAFLVHEGVAAERLTAAGYADTIPIASNANSEGRAQNRRVEIRFVPAALVAQ